jgi:hypothetical protein
MMSDNRTERGRERAPGCGSTGTSSCLQVLAGFAPQWVKRGPMQYFGDAFDAKCCGVAARLRCPTSAGRRGAAAALAAASGARAAAARRAAAVSKRPPLSAAQCSEECIYGILPQHAVLRTRTLRYSIIYCHMQPFAAAAHARSWEEQQCGTA